MTVAISSSRIADSPIDCGGGVIPDPCPLTIDNAADYCQQLTFNAVPPLLGAVPAVARTSPSTRPIGRLAHMARQLRCVIMRGGTSKAVFLKEADLPEDEAERTRTILSVFGSPDRRQIDGLGGADPLTS